MRFTNVEPWQKNYGSINERYTENLKNKTKKNKNPAYQQFRDNTNLCME